MDTEIEKTLARIGGRRLVSSWHEEHSRTAVVSLPTTEIDAFSIGYAIVIGSLATAADLILDKAFREDMQERHRLLSPDEQKSLEDAVKKRMEALGVKPEGKGMPGMAMDWYEKLNDELGLKSPYRLRPSNHRMLNHTDRRTVIEMLMKGEAGFGDLRFKLYPEMSEAAARELFDLHLAADRSSPASLPLRFMAWLWEQGIKAADPSKAGAPSTLFLMLQKMTPNVDWAKWLNQFFNTQCIPEGASLSDAMLKLYDSGVLNERVFWTSDFGAAVGGFKRRAIIAAVMELGVELFSFIEGLQKGHIKWNGEISEIASQYARWRDQPKYLDMKIIAQATASSGGLTRAALEGDVLNMNYISLAMIMKHLWTHPATTRRHTNRMVRFSLEDRSAAITDFTRKTGIKIHPQLSVINGDSKMASTLDLRLIKAGCMSTRVRVLAVHLEEQMADVVSRYEALSKKANGCSEKEALYDSLCESWYLCDEEDDQKALIRVKSDLEKVESKLL